LGPCVWSSRSKDWDQRCSLAARRLLRRAGDVAVLIPTTVSMHSPRSTEGACSVGWSSPFAGFGFHAFSASGTDALPPFLMSDIMLHQLRCGPFNLSNCRTGKEVLGGHGGCTAALLGWDFGSEEGSHATGTDEHGLQARRNDSEAVHRRRTERL